MSEEAKAEAEYKERGIPPNYVRWSTVWHGIDKRTKEHTFCNTVIPKGSKVKFRVTQPDRAMACGRCFAI